MMNAIELKEHARKRALAWTKEPFDAATRQEVGRLLEENGDALVEHFYTDLEFGTGGLRGLMGPGTNRMNRYTIAQTTQGLAQYILDPGFFQSFRCDCTRFTKWKSRVCTCSS